jgi:protein O-GlcNAc transferase
MRGHIEPAVKAMAKAAECDHENAETYSNLGLLLKESRRHEDAIVCLQRALELDPKRADAHNNLAVTLLDMNRLAEAEASARAAVAIDPKNALAWNTIGVALMGQSRMAGAVDAYRRVLKLEPNNAGVHSNMLFAMSQMEDIDAKALFAEHLRYAERVEAPLRKKWRAHANERDPQRQMRIGFVSGDLRHHAVASFIEPIFERLAGRPGVALYAYHNHVLTDASASASRATWRSGSTWWAWTTTPWRSASATTASTSWSTCPATPRTTACRYFARKPAPIQAHLDRLSRHHRPAGHGLLPDRP